MLRDVLRDGAVAAAKNHAHEAVEPRHLLYAGARHLRAHPDIKDLLPRAKRALEPRGQSHDVPGLTAGAARLLERMGTETAVVDALRAAFLPETPVAGSQTGCQHEIEASCSAVACVKSSPHGRQGDSVAEVLNELDTLVGLDSVKQQVRQALAVVQANAERSKAGLPVVSHGLHLVFTGPPGTGKTTVARLIARLYACAGALPGSNFVEATRADLVAGYVGQTAIKTTELLQRARPGVLFIDEAYALAPTHPSDFSGEAIATLVKAMEDQRQELAIIVAGYGAEMVTFVASNPGLRSRFTRQVDFPAYQAHELVEMFIRLAKAHDVALGGGVLTRVERAVRAAREDPSSGNARFVRSLFEECYARMSTRAAADGIVELHELQELLEEDVEASGVSGEPPSRRVGFGQDGAA